MDLHDYLTAIASSYDHSTLQSPGHDLLKLAADQMTDLVPGGLRIVGSGGLGRATFTPWIAVMDPDETESPQRGIYVVYLFAKDMQSVFLTINQGITDRSEQYGYAKGRKLLLDEAANLRTLVPALADYSGSIDLAEKGRRARGYEAGTIAAVEYSIAELPGSSTLEADLWELIALQQVTVAAKRKAMQQDPGVFELPSAPLTSAGGDPLANFAPKSGEEYTQHLEGETLVKSRRHETLVKQYGEHAASIGFTPVTAKAHPRDLLLRIDGKEWLVEAKVLYNGNATHAVREALGQLAMYEFLLHDKSALKLALFTEPIGEQYVSFLEHLGIASVWKVPGGWSGSATAEMHQLF